MSLMKSLKARISLLSLAPAVGISIVLSVTASFILYHTVENQYLNEVRATALSIRAVVEALSDGDYNVRDGELYIGETDMTYLDEVFDEILEDTGMYTTLFYGDTRYVTSVKKDNGERAIGTQASAEVSAAVLAGYEYSSADTDVNGTSCMVIYLPLYHGSSHQIAGMLFAGIPRSAMTATMVSVIRFMVIFALALTAIVAVIAYRVASKLNSAVVGASTVCGDLAEGDFTRVISGEGKDRGDELGDMVNHVAEMHGSFRVLIGGVKQNVEELNAASENLSDAADNATSNLENLTQASKGVASGASTQAHLITESSHSVRDILENLRTINDNVLATEEATDRMDRESNDVIMQFGELLETITELVSRVDEVNSRMDHVANAVENVTNAANEIDAIASQTNLLSLNASIEAARAGEAGRGFAVVAGEISSLSDQSNAAAATIKDIMVTLSRETEEAISMVSGMGKMMEAQNESSQNSKKSLQVLVDNIREMKAMVTEIAQNSKGVNQRCVELNDAISNLSAISEENAAASEQSLSSTEQVEDVSKNVSKMADRIREMAIALDSLTERYVI